MSSVIVFGQIDFAGKDVSEILRQARPLIEVVYDEPGCVHYVWTADPFRSDRMWVYEEWESVETLAAHLSAQPYFQMRDHLAASGITGATVDKYRIDAKQPIYDGKGVPQAEFTPRP